MSFGSTCLLSADFLEDIAASGIIEKIVAVAKANNEARLSKPLILEPQKKIYIQGIPKL